MTRAYVYTTFDHHEQPQTIYSVIALTVVGDMLTIEAEKNTDGVSFSAFYRFEPGKWARFTVGSDAPLSGSQEADPARPRPGGDEHYRGWFTDECAVCGGAWPCPDALLPGSQEADRG